MPIFEIETDQGVFEIEADREPTQEEALRAISGSAQPSASPQQGVFQGSSLFKDLGEAVPFWTAPSEFMAGVRSGEDLLSPAVTGPTLEAIINATPGARQFLEFQAKGTLGGGRALATGLNPLAKLIGFVPKVTQATGSVTGGDLDAALQDLLGSRPVGSAAEIPALDTGVPIADVPINTLTEAINKAIIENPPALLGFTPKALAAQASAIRAVPQMVSEIGAQTARAGEMAANLGRRTVAPFRSSAPVDPVAVEAATKKVQDLQSAMEKEVARRESVGGERSARELMLQEELVRAQQEAAALGEQAIQANLELGPQIEALVRSSEQALGTAEGFRGRLPTPQEPAAFGRLLNEAIQEANKGAKIEALEDYTAVKESLPEVQPKLPATNVEIAAENILKAKAAGYSAALERTLKSVLGESSKSKKVDPLSGLSEATRDIYERLPESQKQSFLDQAGIDLLETKSKSYTWDQLQQRYQDLNRFIEEAKARGNNQDVAAYQQLKNATAADMNAYVESIGTDTKVLFDEANARFAANQERLGTSLIRKISSDLANETPESIVDRIVGDKKSSVVENLKQVLSPEKFEQVKSQYAERMMSPSKDVPFDPNHFIKQFDSINNETLKSVFGEDGFRELKSLDAMSKDAIKAQDLQKTLDDFNSKAQAAENAYQRAKTSAEESRILESEKIRAEEAINEIKDEKFSRDVKRALEDLKKAQTPERVSLIVRALYAGLSFGTFALSGAPVAGIAAALAAAAFGRLIQRGGRGVATELSRRLKKNEE